MASGSAREHVLENVRCSSTEAASDSSQQIQVDRLRRAPKDHMSVNDVLRTTGEALHGDEVLATDDTNSDSSEGHVDGPREGLRIESSQSAQEIDPIAVSIADDEYRRNGVIRVPTTQVCLEARLFEEGAQSRELGNGYGYQGISVRRGA